MSVRIRLARRGAKKRPFYRIVVADSRSPRDGRFIAMLGYYDPLKEVGAEGHLEVDQNLFNHWISVGAQMSERVEWFVKKGLIAAPERKSKGKAGK